MLTSPARVFQIAECISPTQKSPQASLLQTAWSLPLCFPANTVALSVAVPQKSFCTPVVLLPTHAHVAFPELSKVLVLGSARLSCLVFLSPVFQWGIMIVWSSAWLPGIQAPVTYAGLGSYPSSPKIQACS